MLYTNQVVVDGGTIDSITNPVPVTGPLTDTQLRAAPVPVTGTVTTAQPSSATASVTSVSASATSVQLLASNASRKAFSVFNDSSAVLYIKFGVTASSTSYTVQVPKNGFYESGSVIYTGEIDGVWASASGAARITEL